MFDNERAGMLILLVLSNMAPNANRCGGVTWPCYLKGRQIYMRSLFRGALLIILSTRNNNSAASLAELTTAFLSL